jgi:tRNA dimethylallyltransferase
LNAAETIFTNNDVAVMVGGTGLYIKAFCEGLDDISPIHTAVRKQVIDLYERGGLEALQQAVKLRDPDFWQTAEQQNPQRLLRALEILISTNEPIAAFRKGEKKQRDFKIIKIGLEMPREQLYQQVNNRVDQMIEAGLLQEVESLLPYKHLNALQTVGYREFFPVFESHEPVEAAIEKLKINTRHYAKRQLTWFKKDPAFRWAQAHHPQLLSAVMAQLNS